MEEVYWGLTSMKDKEGGSRVGQGSLPTLMYICVMQGGGR